MKEQNKDVENQSLAGGKSKLPIIIGAVVAIIAIVVVIVIVVTPKSKDSSSNINVAEKESVSETDGALEEMADEELLESIEEVAIESVEEETLEESIVGETTSDATVESNEESVEESEVSVENLSNEEWVKSLNPDKAIFIIFNDITGERKVLEDGQEYKLMEGDELGFTYPRQSMFPIRYPIYCYTDTEIKYRCMIFNLNLDAITTNTEVRIICERRDTGEEVETTVYLSK